MFLPHPSVKLSIVGRLRDREVSCSASDRPGLNFESCVLMTVSSHSSYHPQEVLLVQFSLYVHKGGLKLDLFHLEAHSGLQVSKKQNVSFPFTRVDSILWGDCMTEKWRARPQTARARISNYVSGGQCNPIHLIFCPV